MLLPTREPIDRPLLTYFQQTFLAESKKDFRLMAAANWRKRYFVLYTPKEPYDKKNSMLM